MTQCGLDKEVIVTGASGFIGQHLVPYLLKGGYRVLAVARNKEKAAKHDWFNEVEFISLDINTGALNLDIKPDAKVIHLAWEGLPNYKSMFHIEKNLPSHYSFISHLVEKGVKYFLIAGTCFEYGHQNGPIAASSVCLPNNPYGYAKDALHRQLRFLQQNQSFKLQWARLFYMYGEGQSATSIISQLDQAIDNNIEIFDMSAGEQLRDYLPVELVAEQIFNLFETGHDGVSNVCSGEPISIKRLVERRIASRHANIKLNLGCYPYQEYEPMAFWGIKDEVAK